jgi:hypothetical protein
LRPFANLTSLDHCSQALDQFLRTFRSRPPKGQ